MFLNKSSAPKLSVSSLTPNVLSSGRAGGGGPLRVVGGAGCETVRALDVSLWPSTPSGTVPTLPGAKFFFLPNQLPLFLLDRLGAWLLMVAGEPGLSDFKLSDDDNVRRPKNFRTDDGRLDVGLAGDKVVLAASLLRARRACSSAVDSSEALPLVSLWCGKTADMGVGCDERGPLPGVGGRGVSGGVSGGAGIDVPSVREKLMGVSVSGLYVPNAMMGNGSRWRAA